MRISRIRGAVTPLRQKLSNPADQTQEKFRSGEGGTAPALLYARKKTLVKAEIVCTWKQTKLPMAEYQQKQA